MTVMSDTITIATWEEATDGHRDTNPFDHIESSLLPHCERVGIYDVVRSYSDHVAESLPEHMDFVGNRFVVDAGHAHADDLDSARESIRAAIKDADARHQELVRDWLS